MARIMITALSDDIEKSKKFVKYLAYDDEFKVELETRDELILSFESTVIKAIRVHEGQRGHRHHKIYVDSASPRAVELALEIFYPKILPIYSPLSRYKLEVKNPMEFVDFEKLMNQ